MREIILITPPPWIITTPPCGLTIINAYLRRKELPVRCHDLNIAFHKHIFSKPFLTGCFSRMERFVSKSKKKGRLTEAEFAQLNACLHILPARDHILGEIDRVNRIYARKETASTPEELIFCNKTLSFSREAISAAYHPLNLLDHESPLGILSSFAEIIAAIRSGRLRIFSDFFAKEAERIIPHTGRHLVGFSCTTLSQFAVVLLWSRFVRKINPDCHIVIGGAMLSLLHRNYRNFAPFFDYVDSVIACDGMRPVEELYEAVSGGRSLADCSNLIWMNDNGKVVFNGISYIASITDFPEPDFTGMPLSDYFSTLPDIALPISRGCYGNCAYCSYVNNFPGGWDQDTTEHIAARMLKLKKKHRSPLFSFAVSTFPLKSLVALAGELKKREAQVYWEVQTRADRELSADECLILRDGGCRLLSFGMESANPRILKLMRKNISVETASTLIKRVHAAGIRVGVNFIYNFPTESYAEFQDTISFIIEHAEYMHFLTLNSFFLDFFSPIWQEPRKFHVDFRIENTNDFLLPHVIKDLGISVKDLERKSRCIDRLVKRFDDEFVNMRTPWNPSLVKRGHYLDLAHLYFGDMAINSGAASSDPDKEAPPDWPRRRFYFDDENASCYRLSHAFKVNGRVEEIDGYFLYNRLSSKFVKLNYDPKEMYGGIARHKNNRAFLNAVAADHERKKDLREHIKLLYRCGFLKDA